MSVALVQGSSGSIGTAFVRHLLTKTNLKVVATSRNPSSTRESILSHDDLQNEAKDRLTVLEMDVTNEATIEQAAGKFKEQFGNGSLRLLLNVSGVLHADKSITQVKQDELLHHYQKALESGEEDPAEGVLPKGLSVLASLTARVGSLGDNGKGGWVGYRSSKAATNQVIVTLQRELAMRATPSIAIALHPGTVVGTNLSKDFTKEEDAGKKEGVFKPDESTRRMLDVIKGLKEGDGGRFLDWAGKDIQW